MRRKNRLLKEPVTCPICGRFTTNLVVRLASHVGRHAGVKTVWFEK